MERVGASRLPLFAVLSVVLHGASFVAVARSGSSNLPLEFASSSQTLVGDTLDIDPPSLAAPDDEEAEPTAASTTTGTRTMAATHLGRARSSMAAASVRPLLYGAVGVRFATDLATTFTRAFPQVASADAAWATIPLGNAGRAQVILVLDGSGLLADSEIADSPSPALRRSIERTLVLLRRRAFTAGGPSTRLTVTARVSRDDVHDGLHGDVFALSAGSFAGEIGTAFFALPAGAGSGRRVDVEVRLMP